MFNNTDFELGGKRGSQMGLMIIRTDSPTDLPFAVTRKIIEHTVRNNFYFYRTENDPLQFQLKFALINPEDRFNDKTRSKIISWLFKKQYQLLISDDMPNICFYVMPVDSPTRWDNTNFEGYITVNFRTDSYSAWSRPFEYKRTFTNNASGTIIEIDNISDIEDYWYPIIDFQLQGTDTGISISNLSDGNNTFTISGLDNNEEIYIDFKMRRIKSSKGDNVYRLGNTNKNWLRLVRGRNRVKIVGNVILKLYLQVPMAI